MYGVRSRGVGTIDSTGNVTFPWYCDAPLLGVWFNSDPDCMPPTQEQLDAATAANIQRAAGAGTPNYNPDLAASQVSAYQADVVALCKNDPINCAAYQKATAPPTNWLLYGGIALGVFALVVFGAGSPRRYGR